MITKIHELNCGSFCPAHSSSYFPTDHMSCRCLLIESSEGLILCDTGLPRIERASIWAKLKFKALQIQKAESEHCVQQIENLGFNIHDVRHIILTHVDTDHAGAINEFPWAEIHLHANEAKYFQNIPFKLKGRFLSEYLPKNAKLRPYTVAGEKWNGFDCVRALDGLSDDLLLVPLLGHTTGHSGIAIKTKNKWLLHCGDAFYFKDDLTTELHKKNLASETFQTALALDNNQRIRTHNQLIALSNTHPEIQLTNSHDPRLGL